MIKLQNISLPAEKNINNLKHILSKILNISADKIKSAEVFRRSVDVRKKYSPQFCYTFIVDFYDKKTENYILKKFKNAIPYAPEIYNFKKINTAEYVRPVIVGSGPAGLFAAITLCKAGIKPIIIEKGDEVEKRTEKIENFRKNGILDTSSNIQFGEGGAGTFSDGKLNTGIKDARIRTVLELFNSFGADPDILVNAKPHIGTDILQKVVKNIRDYVKKCGGEYLFNTTFLKPVIKDNKLTEIECIKDNKNFNIKCETLILAVGNSARDTFEALLNSNVEITSKPFAVGVRIEHLQEDLNTAQYGENYCEKLPPNEYKMAVHLENGRGVYTFCMCPGGYVVNGASEENTVVTNGMSYHARNGKNANSALLVGVTPEDFGENPLDGIKLQQKIEKAAFAISNSYAAPCQTVGSFLYGYENTAATVKPTVLPKPFMCNLADIFPEYITESLKAALPLFDKKIKGFAMPDAVMTGPETRSSSPVKIPRDENFESNIKGIFPAGEGGGHAGGITSSAVDGIKVAEKVIDILSV